MRVCLVVALTFALCCAALEPDEEQCSGSGKWRDECHLCRCRQGRPICRRRACRNTPPRGLRCKGNVTWKPDCNSCYCNGGIAICTLIFCGTEQPEYCSLEFDHGPCKARMHRWGFNVKAKCCKKFLYGGCKGNKNNFKTLVECKRVCEV